MYAHKPCLRGLKTRTYSCKREWYEHELKKKSYMDSGQGGQSLPSTRGITANLRVVCSSPLAGAAFTTLLLLFLLTPLISKQHSHLKSPNTSEFVRL